MSTGNLRQAEEIFHRLSVLPAGERAAALRAECNGDAALAREVESLLEHAGAAGEFLTSSAMGPLAAAALEEAQGVEDLSGRKVGAYRLERRLNTGGMGTVYLASRADGQYTQRVAVKLVKRGMDCDEIVQRFGAERQALAALNHPNIARLLDGGVSTEGRPYIVMEYVDGRPIDQYCWEEGLKLPTRLELFRSVCDAVRYAHQNLVVHRDIKPANILVSADGTVKLLDFGIAKVLGPQSGEPPMVTRHEDRRLTPEYASPEQMAGRHVTTASDVYSLGVILYELLSGQRPHDLRGLGSEQMERRLAAAPAPPSQAVRRVDAQSLPARCGRPGDGSAAQVSRMLRGDLDTIAGAALHADPGRRYSSVEALDADLERYQRNLPIRARRDSTWYRVSKFVRRNRALSAVAVGVTILVLTSTAVVWWQARIAERERDEAYTARVEFEAVSDYLRSMLSAADPANEGPDAKVYAVLDTAAAHAEADLKGRPLVLAAIRSTIGRTYLTLGMVDRAERLIEAAYDDRKRLLDPGHHDMAESKLDMAELRLAQGRFDQAERLLRESLATHERLLGEDDSDIARIWSDLGTLYLAAGDLPAAESAHRRSMRISERTSGRNSLEVAESMVQIAEAQRRRGDFGPAQASIAEAVRIRRAALRPDHPVVVKTLSRQAGILADAGEAERAAAMYREVIELDEKVFGGQHPALAADLHDLGRLLMQSGKWDQAQPLLRRAMEIRLDRLQAGDARIGASRILLGQCLLRLDQPAQAEPLLREGIEAVREADDALDPRWQSAVEDLVSIYQKAGDERAAGVYRAVRFRRP